MTVILETMTFLEAIILGVLQGLTEFLPVSSSGHLVLAQHFLGLNEPLVFFDVMLHVGTLVAVIVVYRVTIARLVSGGLSTLTNKVFYHNPIKTLNSSYELRFVWLIVLGSIPTGIIAVLFKTQLESFFEEVLIVSVMLIVTGLVLQLPRLRRDHLDEAETSPNIVKSWHAPVIGMAQGCAITPGISRSGSTISIALLMGIPAKIAAEYSFLLSIPAILGAVALKIPDIADTSIPLYILGTGMLTAFVVGFIALRLLLAVLNRGHFSLFSYYCVGLGIISLIIEII